MSCLNRGVWYTPSLIFCSCCSSTSTTDSVHVTQNTPSPSANHTHRSSCPKYRSLALSHSLTHTHLVMNKKHSLHTEACLSSLHSLPQISFYLLLSLSSSTSSLLFLPPLIFHGPTIECFHIVDSKEVVTWFHITRTPISEHTQGFVCKRYKQCHAHLHPHLSNSRQRMCMAHFLHFHHSCRGRSSSSSACTSYRQGNGWT